VGGARLRDAAGYRSSSVPFSVSFIDYEFTIVEEERRGAGTSGYGYPKVYMEMSSTAAVVFIFPDQRSGLCVLVCLY
jgi:hypothetical protein